MPVLDDTVQITLSDFRIREQACIFLLAYLYKQAGFKLIDLDDPIMPRLPSDPMAICKLR